MALTARQRNALPDSAFALPGRRKYPVPTKAQARKAGIGERQRLRMLRNALGRSGQRKTAGTYQTIAKKVRARGGTAVKSVGGSKGKVSGPGLRKRRKPTTRRRRK